MMKKQMLLAGALILGLLAACSSDGGGGDGRCDVNRDGRVNDKDLERIAELFNSAAEGPAKRADLDEDGVVGASDFAVFVNECGVK